MFAGCRHHAWWWVISKAVTPSGSIESCVRTLTNPLPGQYNASVIIEILFKPFFPDFISEKKFNKAMTRCLTIHMIHSQKKCWNHQISKLVWCALAKKLLYQYKPSTINDMRWIFHMEVPMCIFHLLDAPEMSGKVREFKLSWPVGTLVETPHLFNLFSGSVGHTSFNAKMDWPKMQ